MVSRWLSAGLLIILLVFMGLVAYGQEQGNDESTGTKYSLASFVDGDKSLQSLIEFPSTEGDVLEVVDCRAWIGRSGYIRKNWCFPSTNKRTSYRRAVEKATRLAEVEAAVVDGETHDTAIAYRVIFLRQEGVAQIAVYENWGSDSANLGADYQAPQRYSKLLPPEVCDPRTAGVGYIVSMVIDAQGNLASDVDVSPIGQRSKRSCVSKIKSVYEEARFIPGTQNGRPVQATLTGIWGDYSKIIALEDD